MLRTVEICADRRKRFVLLNRFASREYLAFMLDVTIEMYG